MNNIVGQTHDNGQRIGSNLELVVKHTLDYVCVSLCESEDIIPVLSVKADNIENACCLMNMKIESFIHKAELTKLIWEDDDFQVEVNSIQVV